MAAGGKVPLSVDLIKGLFSEQEKYLNHFFDTVDPEPLSQFSKAVLNCKGVVFLTGVGKSGFIAQKISMTLVSTGTRSAFLSPTDAFHGDIGILGPDDILVLFSKSGATEELLKLVPYARAKGARLIGVSSVKGSKLDLACDDHVLLPLERELCPFDLAPVTSTAIQMVFGDTCAVAVSKAKKLTTDEYAMNHPAGKLGKRLILTTRELMRTNDLPTCSASALLVDTLTEMSTRGLGLLLVVGDGRKLLGAFTDGDLRRALSRTGGKALQMPMGELMTRTPRTITAGAKAVAAMNAMEHPTPITFMPVVDDDGALVGLLTLHGLVSAGL